MPKEQCWMLNHECSSSHTLTLWIVDSFTNVEWGRMNAECPMLDAEYLLLLSQSHTHTHTHTFSHTQKKSCWAVPNPNRELFIVTSKKTRLNRCPSQQRTLHCDIEKGQTEPSPIRTGNTAIVISKKTGLNRAPSQRRTLHCYIEKYKKNRCPSEQRALHWYIEKGKTESLPNPNRELCIVTSKKTRRNRSCFPTENSALSRRQRSEEPLPIRTLDSALLYRNKQSWTVFPSELRNLHWYTKMARLTRSPSQQTTLHCYNNYLSSSKCSSQKSKQFISNVYQKLDSCL